MTTSVRNVIIKKGFFRNGRTTTIGELSLTDAVLDILSSDTCCAKDITSDSVTGITIVATTSLSTNTISEYTAASGVTIDSVKLKDGGITNTAATFVAGFYPTTAQQALSGAGAVNITSYLTKFTSTGAAQALTIASGSQIGQIKRIWHVVDGGSGVLTGVFVGGTTITFTTANEFADLIWNGSAWGVLSLGNFTAAGASPALA